MNQTPATIAKRFSAVRQPESKARVSTRFLHERLGEPIASVPSADDFRRVAKIKDDTSIRQAMVERLLQIGFTDRVVVVGYDRESQAPIERVSSMECIKAFEVLKKYDLGMPAKNNTRLEYAEHIRQVERDRVATIISILGHKLRDKTPAQIAEYLNACSNDPGKFLELASQAMGQDEVAPEPQQEAQEQLPEQPGDEVKP